MVSAWASSSRLVLAQTKVDAKSNEITAVPALLALLDLLSCIVTADAMNGQRAIASQITRQGGQNVLALKGNQERLHDDGRIETCHLWQVDLAGLEGRWQDVQQEWAGLSSLIMVEGERQVGGKENKVTRETHY